MCLPFWNESLNDVKTDIVISKQNKLNALNFIVKLVEYIILGGQFEEEEEGGEERNNTAAFRHPTHSTNSQTDLLSQVVKVFL